MRKPIQLIQLSLLAIAWGDRVIGWDVDVDLSEQETASTRRRRWTSVVRKTMAMEMTSKKPTKGKGAETISWQPDPSYLSKPTVPPKPTYKPNVPPNPRPSAKPHYRPNPKPSPKPPQYSQAPAPQPSHGGDTKSPSFIHDIKRSPGKKSMMEMISKKMMTMPPKGKGGGMMSKGKGKGKGGGMMSKGKGGMMGKGKGKGKGVHRPTLSPATPPSVTPAPYKPPVMPPNMPPNVPPNFPPNFPPNIAPFAPVAPPPTVQPTLAPGCNSRIAEMILASVPDVITRNPARCCTVNGPTAVYATHALRDDSTPSGFETFWDAVYNQILETSNEAGVCFVMTGIDQVNSSREVSLILIDVLDTVRQFMMVPVIMSTDPTQSVDLIQTIRSISNTRGDPSIGVFNAGYNNIIVESIITDMERLPFVGLLSDSDFGILAAQISLELLLGVPARPLCFNARPDLDFIGQRCTAYYSEITDDPISPLTGVVCNVNSSPQDILSEILLADANAVFTHVDCCAAVGAAALLAQSMGRSLVVGCQDENTSSGGVDFVTAQPIQLEGYQAAVWANFPVIQSQQGKDGRGEQFFPGLESLINTGIFNELVI